MKHAIVVLAIVGAFLAVPGEAGAFYYELNFGQQFGSAGSGNGQFNGDYGLAVDPSGNVWVADSGNNRVQKFSGAGVYQAQYLAGPTPASAKFNKPKGVAVDPSSGVVWVADSGSSRIQRYNGGTSWTIFGSSGTGLGQFRTPLGLDVDASGNIWIADSSNNRIQKFNGISTYTQYGTGGVFLTPSDVAVDPLSGAIWVADTGHNKIQKSTDGGLTWTAYGSVGTGNGQFQSPTGIALGPSGFVWVNDYLNNRIQEFDSNGNWVYSYGTFGTGPGQFNQPTNLDVDALGNVWVADTGNNRVQEFNTSVIPEPVTMAGLALGLSCLTNYIRRRRTA
jgi:DNA-binding beta-propeller fold protein YncE